MGGSLSRTGAVSCPDPARDWIRGSDSKIRRHRNRLLDHPRYRRDPDGNARQARASGNRGSNRQMPGRKRPQMLDGYRRDLFSRRLGRRSGRGSARSARICEISRAQYGRHRTCAGRELRGLLARVARLLRAGRDRRNPIAALVRRCHQCRLRTRHRDRASEKPADPETLFGGEAVRATSRDPASHQRRNARVHRLGSADASGNGRPES